jgi:hypothetical protein
MPRIPKPKGNSPDLFRPVVLLLGFLWLLGLISGYTMGGWVHLLLAVVTVMVLVRFWPGRHPA